MKNTTLILLSALLFSGCTAVDDTINDALSGDTDTNIIAGKEKVLIINNVNYTACLVIKNNLSENENRNNAEVLVTELGVTCATYGKTEGDPLEIENDTECAIESLSEWLSQESNNNITDLEQAEGDQACVIGFDL